jgi:hypothetical protein
MKLVHRHGGCVGLQVPPEVRLTAVDRSLQGAASSRRPPLELARRAATPGLYLTVRVSSVLPGILLHTDYSGHLTDQRISCVTIYKCLEPKYAGKLLHAEASVKLRWARHVDRIVTQGMQTKIC